MIVAALSRGQAARVEGAWSQVAHGLLWVAVDGSNWCMTPPEYRDEAGSDFREDDEDEPRETVLRVWTDESDCWHHCVRLQEMADPRGAQTIRPMAVTAEQVLRIRPTLDQDSQRAYGVPSRAELCALREGEIAALDLLWLPDEPN